MSRWLTLMALGCSSFGTAAVPDAADVYYDPAAMAAARAALHESHGGQTLWMLQGERLEYQDADDATISWEAQGWLGGDRHRLWAKAEGEYRTDAEDVEDAEFELLYGRAIRPFWDLQAGIRHDPEPDPSRSYAVFGVQGIAPYWFEIDTALYVSDRGDAAVRIEAEYELRFTQRLLLQPRVEIDVAFSDDAAIGVGSGVSTLEAGLRLRYEIVRELAPYVGLEWTRAYGDTADFRRAAGEDTSDTRLVAGVRFWF